MLTRSIPSLPSLEVGSVRVAGGRSPGVTGRARVSGSCMTGTAAGERTVIGFSDTAVDTGGRSGTGDPALERAPEAPGAEIEDENHQDEDRRARVCDLPHELAEPLRVDLPDVDRQGRRGVERAPRRTRICQVQVAEVVVRGRREA